MRLAVRVDAGAAIGLGHATRMLALTQAARDCGHQVSILSTGLPDSIAARFAAEGATLDQLPPELDLIEDARRTAHLARAAHWLILDGYRFTPPYLADLRRAGAPPVLAIDDCGHTAGSPDLDAVLNPNLHASEALHRGHPVSCRRLLGAAWALLRREFAECRSESPASARATHILVSCGGSDPAGLTPHLVTALAAQPGDWRATIVIGAAGRAVPWLADPRLSLAVDVQDMAGLMATCDAAIIAAGSTALELACIGVPMAVVATVDNQEPVARALVAAGAALDCGPLPLDPVRMQMALVRLLGDAEVRAGLRHRAATLTDGLGATHTVEVLADLAMQLRRATRDDAKRLLVWANDPDTRRWSFSSRPIAWPEHLAWLERRLTDPDAALLIAEDGHGRPVGTSRLTQDEDGICEISLTVAPERRGHGTGRRLIAATCRWAWANRTCRTIRARIRPDNQASQQAFVRCGFQPVGMTTAPDGSPCTESLLERPAHA